MMSGNKMIMFLLIGLVTLLINLIYYQINQPEDNDYTAPGAPEDLNLESPEISTSTALPGLTEFQEITQRPLFSSNRLPPDDAPAPEQTIAPTRQPDLQLTGIVQSNEEEFVLFASKRKPKLERIKLNDTIDGWKLIEIGTSSVKLQSGNNEITLDLIRKTDPKRAAQLNQAKNLQNRSDEKPEAVDQENHLPSSPDNQTAPDENQAPEDSD